MVALKTTAPLRALLLALSVGVAGAAIAQTAAPQNAAPQQASPQPAAPSSVSTLKLPSNPELFGKTMPSVFKATAIVNGDVITQTDIDQRLALIALANETPIPADQVDALRQQVLANLIDESLQIQAAKAEKIELKEKDIDRAVTRLAAQTKQTPEQLTKYLEANGSSIRSVRRQLMGDLAWQELQRAKIEDTAAVAEDEVKGELDRLKASKGSRQYKVSEIYLPAAGGDTAQAAARANQILEQLRKGASFAAYARQFSEASTAAVGGDLGWVRPEQLPDTIAAALQTMSPGTVSNPIPVPGGVSIIGVEDVRSILVADPRNAVLSLKQITVKFPAGTTRAQAEPAIARFSNASKNIGGCGGAEKLASEFNGEVIQSDEAKMRDLPVPLQNIMTQMQVGQVTPPFGSLEEGIRVLVLCGREIENPTLPSYDQVYAQLNEQRVNARSRRYLRDLRRDAVIEFR